MGDSGRGEVGPELGDVQVATGVILLGHAANEFVHDSQREWRGLGFLNKDGDEAGLGQFFGSPWSFRWGHTFAGSSLCCGRLGSDVQGQCLPVTERD